MLLERESVLGSLHDHLTAASQGSGSLVLVAGEAGAGKTSLVAGFVESLSAATLVIQGACDPLTTPRPLSPLHDFAADPDSGLDDLNPGDRPAMELFGQILERLRKTIRPIVMVIEDVHWADDATLDFLRFIGRRVGDTKAMVTCTYRDDELGGEHPLRLLLGQLLTLPTTERLSVPPLSASAVEQLSRDHDIDPLKLHQRTGGNAFFVTEVLAAGDALPTTVQHAVVSRLAHLSEPSRRTVEAVSIAPRSLDIGKAATLVDSSLDSVDEAVTAGVLVEERGDVRFRHELARVAIEESIPPARRLQLHRRMIAMLEEEDHQDWARLAHHAVRSESQELIIRYAPQAGDEAANRGARREAVAFYRAAIEQEDGLGPDRVADLRIKLGNELRLIDRPDESERELRLAMEHYRNTGQVLPLADALGLLQGSLWNLKRFEEGWEAINEALEILRPLGPSEVLGMTLYRVAHHHMLARHAAFAFRYLEEAEEVARQIDSDHVRWLTLMMRGCVSIVVGDTNDGVRLLTQAIEEAEKLDSPRFLSIGLAMLGSGGGEARRYEVAIPALERAVDQGLATDEDYSVAYDRSWLARIAFEQGRWDDAVHYAEVVQKTTQQREGIASITALSALGRVRVRRGDPGGIALLEEMVDLARVHELQHGWNAICGRAEHLWLVGDPEKALDELAPAYQRAIGTDSAWARGEIGFWMWRAGAIETPPDGAAEPFALQIAGEWQAAADIWMTIGCPYEVAMALADGPENAKVQALEILDALGARPLADRIRQQLRAMGADNIPRRPTRQTLSNPGALTERQLDVLRLIARGISNEQIAEELFISKKTVEHHASAIYSKLGVSSRPEAVRAAVDMGALDK
jgi:DNA-binding CsgD family transcriptional regulator/tetratricopeptide (TPR) repeat protein